MHKKDIHWPLSDDRVGQGRPERVPTVLCLSILEGHQEQLGKNVNIKVFFISLIN